MFIQRLRDVRASLFVWAAVLSRFGSGVPGFAEARTWYQRLGGKRLCPRPFQKRFLSPRAVALMENAFDSAVATWRAPAGRVRHVLSRHFSDIVLVDSTIVQLLDSLRRALKGTRTAKAALKISLAISAFGRLPLFARMAAGSVSDHKLFPDLALFPARVLWLFDRGFVAFERLRQIGLHFQFYLCPMRHNGNPLVLKAHSAPRWVRRRLEKEPLGIRLQDLLALLPKGQRLARPWDLEVHLIPHWTADDRTPIAARLLVMQGPKRLRFYLTNLPPTWMPKTLAELYRLRWQIELVFKELKQELGLTAMPSKNRYAVQVFAWSSLVALALSRVVAEWIEPVRRIVGLEQPFRPALVSRALRGSVRLLVLCLRAPLQLAVHVLRFLRTEIIREARSTDTHRQDSFARLTRKMALQAPA
jgi:Transposase DDE domain